MMTYVVVGMFFHLTFLKFLRRIAENITKNNPLDAHHYHYFSYDVLGGTSGIARTLSWAGSEAKGSICFPQKQHRTAISEWINNEATTALVKLFNVEVF
jgi:hypothetical protein